MKGSIKEVKLSSWGEIHELARRNSIYRGQRQASWDLATSLERCFAQVSIPTGKRIKLEAELLREFRRAYHNYALHIPDAARVLEWHALMQHHGAPTRFLDFTYSIYVAAYFALEGALEDCAVWAVNADWAMDCSLKALRRAGKRGVSILSRATSEKHETVSSTVLFNRPFVKSALVLNPFRLNERLRIQKGIFLVPGDVTGSFMDNLYSLPGHDEENNLLKIVLPSAIRQEALEKLHYMHISRTSLFPGLDGYSRSLGIYHPAFRTIR